MTVRQSNGSNKATLQEMRHDASIEVVGKHPRIYGNKIKYSSIFGLFQEGRSSEG
jgi:hypothetical protein